MNSWLQRGAFIVIPDQVSRFMAIIQLQSISFSLVYPIAPSCAGGQSLIRVSREGSNQTALSSAFQFPCTTIFFVSAFPYFLFQSYHVPIDDLYLSCLRAIIKRG
jgi:hypothetical protein